ncbi:MAG TPA: hypothetical protein DCZ30_04725 [Clostridiales bacterium]|nr:hypothetical protein [Clostridiales bacterium]
MENKINYLDWNSIMEISNGIAKDIKKSYNPDIIISVVRGGMIPSVILSHILDIRDIENINVKETISDEINSLKHEPIVDKNLNLNKIKGKKVLVVDDIIGSGATIRKIKEEIEKWEPDEIKTAVCVVNEENWEKSNEDNYESSIDYKGKCVRGWVVFPWETR